MGGPKTPQQVAAQRRLQQTQAQVDEVCMLRINDSRVKIHESVAQDNFEKEA